MVDDKYEVLKNEAGQTVGVKVNWVLLAGTKYRVVTDGATSDYLTITEDTPVDPQYLGGDFDIYTRLSDGETLYVNASDYVVG